VSLSGLSLHGKPIILLWQGVLEYNLSKQQALVTAIPVFLDQYSVVDRVLDTERRDRLVTCFIDRLVQKVRRDFSSARSSCMSKLAHFNNCGKYLTNQLTVFFLICRLKTFTKDNKKFLYYIIQTYKSFAKKTLYKPV
jgi:hypothetical protein